MQVKALPQRRRPSPNILESFAKFRLHLYWLWMVWRECDYDYAGWAGVILVIMVIARNRTPSQCVALIITIKSAVQERKGSLVKDIKPSQKEKSDYIFSFGNVNVACVQSVGRGRLCGASSWEWGILHHHQCAHHSQPGHYKCYQLNNAQLFIRMYLGAVQKFCNIFQTQGRCAENYLVSGAACSPASNQCSQGHYLKKGHGIMTGTVQYSTVLYRITTPLP